MVCALSIATKADHFHISLSKFIAKFESIGEDDAKSLAFLLLQNLRFTLDVRHPMKGLAGDHTEMNVTAEGQLGGISKANGWRTHISSIRPDKSGLPPDGGQQRAYRGISGTKLADLPSCQADIIFTPIFMLTISACAKLLESYRSLEDSTQPQEIKAYQQEINRLSTPGEVGYRGIREDEGCRQERR
ncbi:uncharacterized protein Z518_05149 [Rhinocladiella mackenziei CBS 650.93]|uniref:Rhinocladiella mackenziei CBS 650.93 unplaced genomic scaffold supercont1.4, whole genome shotgun sequence n=1 Tax=Rhinocladiella mackenziei CBS 650.93 TaxID=1442369 RepID=A0A0D2FPZ8_9EURO|nr:uncharacterized protein Z518_05149 [Rhinocladiella mackenziei CBS 650.93]KIX04282.1 hypothetical protein Z518_05149 [Rhinocladiella mackenziei CBS 650.93]